MHVKGNEAQRSIVHAIDVAKAVRAVSDKQDSIIEGIYNLTDRSGATIEQLADAIAYRLEKLDTRTTTLTFNSFAISKHTAWEPMSATEYLKTHKYSEDDI